MVKELEKEVIKISELVKNHIAVTTEDGEVVYKEIDKLLQGGKAVILDFSDLEIIISTFFNAAIGQLYSKYTGDVLRQTIFVTNLSNDDLNILVKVIERAKQYFADQNRFEKTINPDLPDDQPNNKN